MKQPDTAALRERLANHTTEQELEEDRDELDGLLQEVGNQILALRNLLKEINALKEELHGIHGSMKHTVQRERTAFNALLAAKDSANNIVDGICTAIVKAEQDTVIPVKIGTEELEKVNQCTDRHIKAQEQILENHRKKMARCLRCCGGIWLSNRWLIFMLVAQVVCYFAVVVWALCKS